MIRRSRVSIKRKDLNLCLKQMECGHKCHRSQNHSCECYCTKTCGTELNCGHLCRKLCKYKHSHDVPCRQMCKRTCLHGFECPMRCGEPCKPCMKRCRIHCLHKSCKKKCHIYRTCEMPIGCTLPCLKKCTTCGSKCIGLCGHACPPCPKCNPFKCPISLHYFDDLTTGAYKLVDCGCSFELQSLDAYIRITVGKKEKLDVLSCPMCHVPIQQSLRYATEIRSLMYKKPRERRKQALPIYSKVTNEEVQMIVKAMGDSGSPNQEMNHWYKCPKGHPFYVGNCGTPTIAGHCPECYSKIGHDGKNISEHWDYTL